MKIDSTLDSTHYEYVDGLDTIKVDTLEVLTDTGDTATIVKEVIHDVDYQIIERLLDDPDWGGKIVSVLILAFAVLAVLKRWKKTK